MRAAARALAIAALIGNVACPASPPDAAPTQPASTTASDAPAAGGEASSSPAASATPSAAAPSGTATSIADPPLPATSPERAATLLFLDERPPAVRACLAKDDASAAIHCLIAERYDDARAEKDALALYDLAGVVVGVEEPHRMDGGWRGHIDIVPELPQGQFRGFLPWLLTAYQDFDTFMRGIRGAATEPVRYRHAPVELRFFRSVGRTTPSAYASDWTIAFNVRGSLHSSADAVRETMFHETFHLNDRDHGRWSESALSPTYDAIVARCTVAGKLSTPCLRPYAPHDTMVRGGTFYAFQPGNGVWEYAAELAVRYYQEQRAAIAKHPSRKPAFKCGPAENATAWQLFSAEFFAGVDLVPACP